MRRMMRGGGLALALLLIAVLIGCSGSGSSLVNSPIQPGTGQSGNNTTGGTPTGNGGGGTGQTTPGNNSGGATTGGGGGQVTSQGGRAVFQVNWDSYDASAKSTQIQVLQGDNVIATQVVNRSSSSPVSQVTFDNLPEGLLHFIATVFSDFNAHGSALEQALDQLPVKINQLISTILKNASNQDGMQIVGVELLSPEIHVGQSVPLIAEIHSLDGATLTTPTHAFTWTTDDPHIATVDSNGILHGVSPGTANVTATLNYTNQGTTVYMQMTTTVTVLP